jgi:serine/threonine-protein kinase
MGSVYLATQLGLDRKVALKAIASDDSDLTERFRREAVALAEVSHSGVVEIYDFMTGSAETSGRCYLIMAYINGVDLETHVKNQPERRLSPQTAVDLLLPVVSALVELHALGIIHRDLKPANLVRHVRADGRAMAKLVDFGIARREVDPGLTATGSVLGTPAYLAPEALFGRKQTPPSDVYSLGATIFELLTGAPPFGDGKPVEIIRRVMEHRLDLPLGVAGSPLGDLVVRMLDMEPQKRPTALEALKVFESLAHGNSLLSQATRQDSTGPATPRARGIVPSVDAEALPQTTPTRKGPTVDPFGGPAESSRSDLTDPLLGPLPPPGLPAGPGRVGARRSAWTPLAIGLAAGLLVAVLALAFVSWRLHLAVGANQNRPAAAAASTEGMGIRLSPASNDREQGRTLADPGAGMKQPER